MRPAQPECRSTHAAEPEMTRPRTNYRRVTGSVMLPAAAFPRSARGSRAAAPDLGQQVLACRQVDDPTPCRGLAALIAKRGANLICEFFHINSSSQVKEAGVVVCATAPRILEACGFHDRQQRKVALSFACHRLCLDDMVGQPPDLGPADTNPVHRISTTPCCPVTQALTLSRSCKRARPSAVPSLQK